MHQKQNSLTGRKAILCLKGVMLMVTLITVFSPGWISAQTINPIRYYTFNGTNAATDSMGIANLNFTTYNSQYVVENNGQVGKFLTLNENSSLIDGGSMTLSTGVSIELLLKPGYNFNTTKLLQRGDDAFAIRMEYSILTFTTTHKTSTGTLLTDNFEINLDGIGRKSYGYYVDNAWHHIVFKFDASTGVKSVWVDGQLPSGFSKTIATGTFQNTGNINFYLNHSFRYVKYYGSIDELAIYNTAIPDNLIYKHYLGVQAGQPYNFVNNYSSGIPTAAPVTGAIDPMEYGPGHPNVNVTATNQLLAFPGPRYKAGHTLHANIPLYGVEYLGGLLQPGTTYSQVLNNSKIQQADLIHNFNQSILVASNTSEYIYVDDTTKFAGYYTKYANLNPSKHTSMFTFWPGVNPTAIGRSSSLSYSICNCLSNNHYLRNSSGQFLDAGGNVTSQKFLSPAAPVDSLAYDGLTQRLYLQQLTARLTRPLNLIFENGEVIPFYNNATVLSKDPAVVTDKNNTGLDWYSYEGRRAKDKVLAYRNQFMNLSALTNTKFMYYGVDGQPTWRFKYSEMRQSSSMMNGQVYPTGDIYMRFPNNWRYWSSAWHGWQWVAESRKVELENGDKLYSPPVAAGWDNDETKNVRPAQWLGMLKTFSMSGAEFFYPSFFNLSAPFPDSKNWVWQVVMPAYSQAISSRYEDLFRNGFLMEGDVPNDYVNPTWNAFSFKAGDLRKLVVIRKHNTLNKYAITGTLQPNSNSIGNAENSGIAVIALDNQTLKFKVRRQGSTYIYDKTNSSAPVFYQLDEWHEATHPHYWSKDFVIEAELFDNVNSNVVIKTSVPAGTPAGDYTNYTSAVGFNTATDVVYNFLPRQGTASTQYFWVRARSKDGSSTGFNVRLSGGSSQTFDCIKDTNWVWYRFNTNNAAVVFTGISGTEKQLVITATNTKLEIDKIHLTSNSGAIYSGVPNPCSTAQATITPQGATTFCQGGSVVLSASSGTSYLWSNGATSQNITVTSSGTFTVTVTTAGVGSSTSSPTTVTVHTLPTATITPGGPTTFCAGGSVTLTSSSGAAYLWSPGNQTSQSITVSSAGTYNVRVTNSNGCSKVSTNTTVTVNSLPVATITPSGSLNIIQGQTVTLTSSSGTSYLWSPGNQTTSSITVGIAGSYTVRVTNSSGCSAVSAPAVVTVAAAVPATITPSGPTSFCSGGSVTLTANSGTAYLWSTGATTQAITTSTGGNYTVTVTNNGIPSVSPATSVTVWSLPTSTITAGGSTTFCSGGSVTLTASSASSYLWSPGNQTTQSITVTSSGSYSVRVTNSSGCTKVSSNTVVTVNALPAATITPSGSLNLIQGQTVTLTSSSGSSYLWLPGNQTTSSITVGTAGSYTVRVTNSSGCSATSAPAVVTVGTSVPATITPSGPTSFCSGGSVSLTANTGTAYLWSTGATTKTITATTSGNYIVTVTNNGIPSVSPATTVTVWSLPTATITASGSTSICSGSSITLTASAASSYLWTPGGQTSQSIVVSTAGTYNVTVTNSNGCTNTANPVTTSVINCSSSCDEPYGLITNSVTSNSAIVSWTSPNTGQTAFQVKLKNMSTNYSFVTGTVPNTTTTIGVGANSNTTYRWWARSWCGNAKSTWAGYLTYTTPLARPGRSLEVKELSILTPVFPYNDEEDTHEIVLREDEVQLFPNPASDASTITFKADRDEIYTINIIDKNGKVVTTQPVNAVEGFNIYTFDISQLQRGMYFVQLLNNNGNVIIKLAVQ